MSEPTEPLVCPYCGLEEVTDTSRLDGCGCDGCDPPVDDVPTGKTPTLHEQLAASQAREARLREALNTLLSGKVMSIHDNHPWGRDISCFAVAFETEEAARSALAAGGEGDAPATVSRDSVVQVLGKLMARCQGGGLPTQGDELCDALNKGRRGAFAYAAKWLREATGIGVDEGQRVAEQITETESRKGVDNG